MNDFIDGQIRKNFAENSQDVERLLAPLVDLSKDSSTLILGYGLGQPGSRESMVPYFHVCGTKASETPVRVLVIGGWIGTETVTALAAARLIAALESRLNLAEGIEVTAYPVANLEAHRAGVYLTAEQEAQGARCWEDSPCSHVRVIERELGRYPYDLIILLRENNRRFDCEIEAWLVEDEQKIVISDALRRYDATGFGRNWKVNPVRPTYRRTFTPMPEVERQPSEVVVALPGARTPEEQATEALGLILSLSHSVRQAKLEGLL